MHKIDAHSLELCVAVFLYSQRKPAHFPILSFVVVLLNMEWTKRISIKYVPDTKK